MGPLSHELARMMSSFMLGYRLFIFKSEAGFQIWHVGSEEGGSQGCRKKHVQMNYGKCRTHFFLLSLASLLCLFSWNLPHGILQNIWGCTTKPFSSTLIFMALLFLLMQSQQQPLKTPVGFKHLSNLQSCKMDTSKLQLSGFMKTIEGGNKTIALLFPCRGSSSGASSSWGRRRISWGSFPSSVSQMQMTGSQWRAIQGGTVKIKLLQPQKSIFFSRWPQTDKSQKSAK